MPVEDNFEANAQHHELLVAISLSSEGSNCYNIGMYMVLKPKVQKMGARLQAGCHVSFLTILRRRGHQPGWVHEAGVCNLIRYAFL